MYNSLQNNSFFLISLGAVPAALFRWQIDGIFIANIIGCCLLGFINALPISRNSKLIFGFGFCGSLTTFSGWTFKLFELISQGSHKLFLLYALSTVLIGIFSVGLGNCLAKKIHG